MVKERQQPEEEPEKTLGQRIRAKREELDWSQEKLAEEIGVSSLTIMRWELDRSFPRGDETQLSLIEVLSLPKNEFTKKRKKNPAQKKEAESILLDYFEVMYPNEQEKTLRSWASKYSFNFKMDFTAWFDKRDWELWSGAITAWLQEQRENGDPAPSHMLSDIDDGWTGWWKRWNKYKGT
jgi:transcriptional regulator with XRE-family HTH domain